MTPSVHDEEVLGKAYDARLMGRLLAYLRPYWRQVALALVAIIGGAGAQLAQGEAGPHASPSASSEVPVNSAPHSPTHPFTSPNSASSVSDSNRSVTHAARSRKAWM